jgi:hypothetical protein
MYPVSLNFKCKTHGHLLCLWVLLLSILVSRPEIIDFGVFHFSQSLNQSTFGFLPATNASLQESESLDGSDPSKMPHFEHYLPNRDQNPIQQNGRAQVQNLDLHLAKLFLFGLNAPLGLAAGPNQSFTSLPRWLLLRTLQI